MYDRTTNRNVPIRRIGVSFSNLSESEDVQLNLFVDQEKIDRESAAKFSFLLSTPIVAAAVLVDLAEFALTSIPFWVGVFSSFIVGLIVVKFLMDYLKKGSFKVFAIYRVILGILIFGVIFIR